MKRVDYENRYKIDGERRDASVKWLKRLKSHPVPDIAKELCEVYRKFTGNTIEAKWNDNMLIDDEYSYIWQSPTTGYIRFGADAALWPVADQNLWPLNEQRAFLLPQLTKNVWQVICLFLRPIDLLNLKLVSKKLHEIVCDEKAMWWVRRRDAFLLKHPGMQLPRKMWLWYARWRALECEEVESCYDDYSTFLTLSMPDGVPVDQNRWDDLFLDHYQRRCHNRRKNFRKFKNIMGHVFDTRSGTYLVILETYAPTKLMIFWGYYYADKLYRTLPWYRYTEKLLVDEPTISVLHMWENYKK